jgi:hypothetical protein
MKEARYALYFVPPAESALYRFGASALGYDCYTGYDLESLSNDDLCPAGWSALTAEPRTYGFHATLKSPFYLNERFAEHDLVAAFTEFAARQMVVPAFSAAIGILDDFAALTPTAPVPALNALAEQCVRQFDGFRAPMGENERARRLKHHLTQRQLAYLDRWGYPYVLEDFRFHMTLSGRLSQSQYESVLARLNRACSPDALNVSLDSIALLRQDAANSRFRVLTSAPLCGSAARRLHGAQRNAG